MPSSWRYVSTADPMRSRITSVYCSLSSSRSAEQRRRGAARSTQGCASERRPGGQPRRRAGTSGGGGGGRTNGSAAALLAAGRRLQRHAQRGHGATNALQARQRTLVASLDHFRRVLGRARPPALRAWCHNRMPNGRAAASGRCWRRALGPGPRARQDGSLTDHRCHRDGRGLCKCADRTGRLWRPSNSNASVARVFMLSDGRSRALSSVLTTIGGHSRASRPLGTLPGQGCVADLPWGLSKQPPLVKASSR